MWTQNLNQRHKFTCKIHWQLLASVVCAKVVFFQFIFLEHFLVQNQHSCFWENFFGVLYFQSIFTSEYTVLWWMFCQANLSQVWKWCPDQTAGHLDTSLNYRIVIFIWSSLTCSKAATSIKNISFVRLAYEV